MFRYRKSVPVSYDRQAYIYYCSRLFGTMSAKKQARIRQLCREAGGQHHGALLDFMTGKLSAVEVCRKYYISQSTLDRVIRKYYMIFPREL